MFVLNPVWLIEIRGIIYKDDDCWWLVLHFSSGSMKLLNLTTFSKLYDHSHLNGPLWQILVWQFGGLFMIYCIQWLINPSILSSEKPNCLECSVISIAVHLQMVVNFMSKQLPLYTFSVFIHTGVVGVVVSSLALHRGDPGSAYRQFGFMPKMEVHTCYNSQKVTAASV